MTVNCETPGLRIEWRCRRANMYAELVHVGSGAVIRKFTSTPIEGGKRKFAAKVDSCVGHVDWTRAAAELVADEAAKRAAYDIPYDCRT